MRPRTPAGHPLISALWIASALALGASVWLLSWAAAALGAAGLLAGWAAIVVRTFRHRARILKAERLVDNGDLAASRAILSPLLEAFPSAPEVQRAAGLLLYSAGDPLSASSLLERALGHMGP
ncbi:MAG: hypothetical protein FJ104_13665, partial [Deltaproteobacteria bacterium]|nr:hypothetical protein [Deltaproteobacteria bacterium]